MIKLHSEKKRKNKYIFMLIKIKIGMVITKLQSGFFLARQVFFLSIVYPPDQQNSTMGVAFKVLFFILFFSFQRL